jgi:hypothetical protein
MKRIVKFEGDKAAKRFDSVRMALLNSGDGKGERSRDRVRREARVLDLLDTISEPIDQANPDGPRKLKADGGTLTLDQPDHKLIEDYLSTAPWNAAGSRGAVDAQDWWESAGKEE